MSVLINDMKMPEHCWQCPCFDDMGHICNLDNDCRDVYDGRPDWCPLVEFPEKHGRLIDADAMCNDLATVDPQYETMIDWCIRVTEAQPTVIEAEGEE